MGDERRTGERRDEERRGLPAEEGAGNLTTMAATPPDEDTGPPLGGAETGADREPAAVPDPAQRRRARRAEPPVESVASQAGSTRERDEPAPRRGGSREKDDGPRPMPEWPDAEEQGGPGLPAPACRPASRRVREHPNRQHPADVALGDARGHATPSAAWSLM